MNHSIIIFKYHIEYIIMAHSKKIDIFDEKSETILKDSKSDEEENNESDTSQETRQQCPHNEVCTVVCSKFLISKQFFPSTENCSGFG